jgi:hypothetical protein
MKTPVQKEENPVRSSNSGHNAASSSHKYVNVVKNMVTCAGKCKTSGILYVPSDKER